MLKVVLPLWVSKKLKFWDWELHQQWIVNLILLIEDTYILFHKMFYQETSVEETINSFNIQFGIAIRYNCCATKF